jgi:hypothetical protein
VSHPLAVPANVLDVASWRAATRTEVAEFLRKDGRRAPPVKRGRWHGRPWQDVSHSFPCRGRLHWRVVRRRRKRNKSPDARFRPDPYHRHHFGWQLRSGHCEDRRAVAARELVGQHHCHDNWRPLGGCQQRSEFREFHRACSHISGAWACLPSLKASCRQFVPCRPSIHRARRSPRLRPLSSRARRSQNYGGLAPKCVVLERPRVICAALATPLSSTVASWSAAAALRSSTAGLSIRKSIKS